VAPFDPHIFAFPYPEVRAKPAIRSADNSAPNAFVIYAPYQLLNAIEAVHSLQLSNNHLFVILDQGFDTKLMPLIRPNEWASVRFLSVSTHIRNAWISFLGPRLSGLILRFMGRLKHFMKRRRVDAAIYSLGRVQNLFLGMYRNDAKPFMRHFANVLKHDRLLLLDDGTDTLEINRQRNDGIARNGSRYASESVPPWRKVISQIRSRYYDWNTMDAPTLTYFTVYDLEAGNGDRVIKNEYRYLKSLSGSMHREDTVYFIGQCLVEDRFMTAETYLDYLHRVKEHYLHHKIIYIVHPRESAAMVEKIRDCVGLKTRRFNVPIECEMAFHGPIPRELASFFSSALESCRHLLSDATSIVSFQIAAEHLLRGQQEIQSFYNYLESKCDRKLCVKRLLERDKHGVSLN
jgi:hypothetical protein